MRDKSERVHAKLDAARHRFRIGKIGKIVESFRLSLPHPHDFSPSQADICWLPEVKKAIVDGTDKEFQDCKPDIRSRIPELSATWLEERRKVFLELLPQDSPSLEHLSLATTLFDCMKCRELGMHIEDALSHRCRLYFDAKYTAKFSNITGANTFYHDVGAPWNSGLAEYRYSAELSAIAREIVLESGENPDTITTQEMNKKYHRFVRFEGEAINILSWIQAVRSEACLLDDFLSDLLRAVRLNTSAITDIYRAGSCGLKNYRSMYPCRRTKRTRGLASTVGGQRHANGVGNTSLLSKIILLFRKFPLGQHAAYRATSDFGASLGTTSLTRLMKIITTKTRTIPSRSNTDQERAFECLCPFAIFELLAVPAGAGYQSSRWALMKMGGNCFISLFLTCVYFPNPPTAAALVLSVEDYSIFCSRPFPSPRDVSTQVATHTSSDINIYGGKKLGTSNHLWSRPCKQGDRESCLIKEEDGPPQRTGGQGQLISPGNDIAAAKQTVETIKKAHTCTVQT
jgi:hypothetical protein